MTREMALRKPRTNSDPGPASLRPIDRWELLRTADLLGYLLVGGLCVTWLIERVVDWLQ